MSGRLTQLPFMLQAVWEPTLFGATLNELFMCQESTCKWWLTSALSRSRAAEAGGWSCRTRPLSPSQPSEGAPSAWAGGERLGRRRSGSGLPARRPAPQRPQEMALPSSGPRSLTRFRYFIGSRKEGKAGGGCGSGRRTLRGPRVTVQKVSCGRAPGCPAPQAACCPARWGPGLQAAGW